MKLQNFLRLCIKTRSRESNCQNRGQRGEGTEGSQGGETGEVPQGQGGKAGQQESTAGPDTESKGQGGEERGCSVSRKPLCRRAGQGAGKQEGDSVSPSVKWEHEYLPFLLRRGSPGGQSMNRTMDRKAL